MFDQLKNRLGIVDLARLIDRHVRFEEDQRLLTNDHLSDMKAILNSHEIDCQKVSRERHTEVMARLEMILTALDKITALPIFQSGDAEILPLEETCPVNPVKSIGGKPERTKGKAK